RNMEKSNHNAGLITLLKWWFGIILMVCSIPALNSQTIEALRYSGGASFDRLRTSYHIKLGTGFDPSVTYSTLRFKVIRHANPGGPPIGVPLDIDDANGAAF